MSTRATIHFCSDLPGRIVSDAIVYKHWDGYPESVLPDLERFFKDVNTNCSDNRFGDSEYLAAKFVVWQSERFANGNRLNFLGLGICREDPGDIQYRYRVICSGELPKVRVEEVSYGSPTCYTLEVEHKDQRSL